MVAVHVYTPTEVKVYSFAALAFVLIFQVAIRSLCVGYPRTGLVLCPLVSLRCAHVQGRPEAMLRILMMTRGVLSLAGLIGVPLANMQIRNIEVLGYTMLAPIVFLLGA
jgi:hypothetical protein